MKAYYKGKELYQTINRDGYILAPNGEVLKLRKNGKRMVRIDGEYVRASVVKEPLERIKKSGSAEVFEKIIGAKNNGLDANEAIETWERNQKELDRHFPSAKGAIKLATLIITTLILCMFVVLAWVVTRILGRV